MLIFNKYYNNNNNNSNNNNNNNINYCFSYFNKPFITHKYIDHTFLSEAFSVNNRRSCFLIFAFGNPHCLESGK